MSALRQAALRRLSSDLASQRFWARVPEAAVLGDGMQTGPVIDALLAIGALSAEEAATWRARFERAAAPPDPEPQLRARALGHLAALRDERLPGDDVDRLGAAAAAFRGVGLLSSQEEAEWRGYGDGSPHRRIGSDSVGEEPMVRFDDSVFRRVLLGPERRAAGLRVTAVELYAGAVVVNWHYSAIAGEGSAADVLWKRIALDDFDEELGDDIDDEAWFDDDDEPLRLTDDVGTRYLPWTGGWSPNDDGARTVTGHSGFAPGVPAAASRLEILVEGETIALSLD